MAWVSGRGWVPGEGVTAAKLNEISSALNAIGDAAQTYTPTWSAVTTPPTIGASSVSGRYRVIGKWADVHISITIGSGFSPGSGNYTFSLPSGVVPLNNGAGEALGIGITRDVSVPTQHPFMAYYFSTTAVALSARDSAGALQVVGAAAPYTWAAGDRITIDISTMEIV